MKRTATLVKIPITCEIARAIAMDYADRAMRHANRKSWNLSDYNLAARKFKELWPQSLNDFPTADLAMSQP